MLIASQYFRVRGSGLVEFVISIALAGAVIVSFSSSFITGRVQSTRAEHAYQVQQEAQSMITIIQRELARAGYMKRGQAQLGNTNPFVYQESKLYQLNDSADCITYRYDRDKNGQLNQESFGFRLKNGGIQQRKGSAVNCGGGLGWETISDTDNVVITQLTFTLTHVNNAQLAMLKTYVHMQLKMRHRRTENAEISLVRRVLARVIL
ncbi:MAG: prepilin peptidase dependent protein B [Moritella sp.]|jgi:prepilin peptidase dependent protein B